MPFTAEQFFAVFRDYNTGIWPAQIFAYVLGVAAVGFALKSSIQGSRVILIVLGLFWLWTGIAYHLLYFSAINPLAYLFAALFVAQGILFIIAASGKDPPRFQLRGRARGLVGGLLIIYSMIIYAGLSYAFGHGGLAGALFGVTPCPVTIFTLGLLIARSERLPWWILVIPVWWALVGTSAAILLGVPEDLMLGIAALLLIVFLAIAREPATKRPQSHT